MSTFDIDLWFDFSLITKNLSKSYPTEFIYSEEGDPLFPFNFSIYTKSIGKKLLYISDRSNHAENVDIMTRDCCYNSKSSKQIGKQLKYSKLIKLNKSKSFLIIDRVYKMKTANGCKVLLRNSYE